MKYTDMTQTILYYPTISIPNAEWLRQVIFYFDKVASIAPRALWNSDKKESLVRLTPELEYLWDEGVYEPLDPEILAFDLGEGKSERQGWPVAHRLGEEFRTKIENENFKAGPNSIFLRVHRGKLNGTLLYSLIDKGLARYDAPEDRWYEAEWLLVEERAALLYMSMLAQALSDIHPESMVPGTDRPEYKKLIYDAHTQESGFLCLETHLQSVLPVPRQDIPFSDILDFKRKREPELFHYRAKIDELHKTLKQAMTPIEVREALRRFGETQSRELANLSSALNDAKIATRWGSVKTLIKTNSPALWGMAAVGAGLAANIATLPISILVTGTMVAGAVEVGSYLVDERNKRRASERASPFALLHHAQQEGILSPS
jgi:hypothetical protein